MLSDNRNIVVGAEHHMTWQMLPSCPLVVYWPPWPWPPDLINYVVFPSTDRTWKKPNPWAPPAGRLTEMIEDQLPPVKAITYTSDEVIRLYEATAQEIMR